MLMHKADRTAEHVQTSFCGTEGEGEDNGFSFNWNDVTCLFCLQLRFTEEHRVSPSTFKLKPMNDKTPNIAGVDIHLASLETKNGRI